jgi:hypothetical protein
MSRLIPDVAPSDPMGSAGDPVFHQRSTHDGRGHHEAHIPGRKDTPCHRTYDEGHVQGPRHHHRPSGAEGAVGSPGSKKR